MGWWVKLKRSFKNEIMVLILEAALNFNFGVADRLVL
jgi:hypothetical protein